ncbi:MAG TPA: hypothetical protein P5056_01630 [Candidatus Paceibacterota bacterium]|nr:hypothetical protein [Candidatus Paceibacterota bacterium]
MKGVEGQMGKGKNYIENPKTKGSGILCCIPQKGVCPVGCADCFFQSGRSFLEPLDENLPNMPSLKMSRGHVIRVNDGNDSNNNRELVLKNTEQYADKFYNTSIPRDLAGFNAPVVLTVNPGHMTHSRFHELEVPPTNLMFVRVRVNTWNLDLVKYVVEHYTSRKVPVVLTFLAYYKTGIPACEEKNYILRKRTLNEYRAITTEAWRGIMKMFEDNPLVHSCGKIEGDKGSTGCKNCGNCLREYFATRERMKSV